MRNKFAIESVTTSPLHCQEHCLTPHQRQQYAAAGFLVLQDQFQADELQGLRRAAAELEQRVGPIVPGNPRIEMDVCHGTNRIRMVWPLVDISEEFAELARDPRVIGPITSIFSGPALLFEDKLNYKYPGGSGFRMHQDYSYWQRCQPSPRLVSALIYLDEATEENGCLQFIPGRHTQGLFSTRPQRSGLVTENEVGQEDADPAQAVKIPGPAGTMVVFSCLAPHLSEPNRSHNTRRAIVLTYNPQSDGSAYEASAGASRRKALAWLTSQLSSPGTACKH